MLRLPECAMVLLAIAEVSPEDAVMACQLHGAVLQRSSKPGLGTRLAATILDTPGARPSPRLSPSTPTSARGHQSLRVIAASFASISRHTPAWSLVYPH